MSNDNVLPSVQPFHAMAYPLSAALMQQVRYAAVGLPPSPASGGGGASVPYSYPELWGCFVSMSARVRLLPVRFVDGAGRAQGEEYSHRVMA